jgi:enamine deaminase RidA (YjgF/YER057c/UK114 family)
MEKETNTSNQTVSAVPGPSAYAKLLTIYDGTGDLAFLSGQLPRQDGKVAYIGTVGEQMSLDEAKAAAKLCAFNCLAKLNQELGEERRLLRILKVTGFVACVPEFKGAPAVIDAASAVFVEALGEHGMHARSAIGVAALPHGAAVEIELIAEVSRLQRAL